MKISLKDYSFLIAVAGMIFILDQVTKFLVRTNIALGDIWSPWPWLTRYVRIAHIDNSGAAFGMLQGLSSFFTLLGIVVVIVIVYYFPRIPRDQWLIKLALGLQLGGALGNLTDRLRFDGHVTDFISVWNFPVFNIADASISIGVAILILSIWFNEQDKQKLDESRSVDQASETVSNTFPEDVAGE